MDSKPNYKKDDKVKVNFPNFGIRPCVVKEYLGVYDNCDGPRTKNHCYTCVDDVTGNNIICSEKYMTRIK